jgi:twitching motility two-component system response regulator PilG
MVIDDSKTIRRTAETLLKKEGCEVVTATDGFEALAKIADHQPQIIFVDIMMPRLDGYQTCALIKNNQMFKGTPVIMLSSKDGLFDKARGRIVGSEQYLTKPFTRDELLTAIRKYVPGRLTAMSARPAAKRASAFDTLLDYEQRSLAHVAGRPELNERRGHWRGVGFRLGQAPPGVVLRGDRRDPAAAAGDAGAGRAAVDAGRGRTCAARLLPVVDLKQFLEGERTVVHEGQRVLVVRQSGGNVAVIIDELFGQRTFNDTHRAELDGENEGRYGHFVNQVYRLADTPGACSACRR